VLENAATAIMQWGVVMKRRVFLSAIVGSILSLLFSQGLAQPNPDTLWTRTYGGSEDDYASSIQQTADGGYIVAGVTGSFGAGFYDFYLVKTNPLGDTLWTRTYGGSDDDVARSLQQTADGGYIMAGYTYSFGAGNGNFYLVKTNSEGDTLWTHKYGGSGGDRAYSVQQTSDGGYIVAGYTYSFGAGNGDYYLVKTNSQGDTLWTRTYGGIYYDYACSIQQTTDGGYIVVGGTISFGAGNWDSYVVKTNSEGDTVWTRTFGGDNYDLPYSVQQTADGGYIVAGYTVSFGVGTPDYGNMYLVKTNGQGDTLWTRTYGGDYDDAALSVQQTADGGYVVAGLTNSFGAGSYDFYLVKTNSQGDTVWTRTCGGSDYDYASSIQQTADGCYVMAGSTESFGAGGRDFYVVKTGPDISETEPAKISTPNEYILYPAYPNPFNLSTQITFALPKAGEVSLKVFNLLGQEVATLAHGMQTAGTHTVFFDGSGLPTGIYFYRLDSGNLIQTRKMVLLK
jgi:uncharacterized delta-60 repeat protein